MVSIGALAEASSGGDRVRSMARVWVAMSVISSIGAGAVSWRAGVGAFTAMWARLLALTSIPCRLLTRRDF